jgi:hypothetical protein
MDVIIHYRASFPRQLSVLEFFPRGRNTRYGSNSSGEQTEHELKKSGTKATIEVGPHRLFCYIQLDITERCGQCASLAIRYNAARLPRGRARRDAGYQLDKVQRGYQPDDFKSMPVIGKDVEEISVSSSSGAHRVIY